MENNVFVVDDRNSRNEITIIFFYTMPSNK